MCSSKRPAGVSRRAGSSLIEVVVSIAILGLVVVPLCSSIVLAHRVNARTEALMQSQLAASAAVERLMAEGVDVSRPEWSWDANASDKGAWVRSGENGAVISAEPMDFDESGLAKPTQTCYNVTVICGEVSIATVVRATASSNGEGGG